MGTSIKIFAVAALLVAATSSGAFARYPCAPGYAVHRGICYPIGVHNYSNPVSGAVTGEAQGAAQGYGSAGPVGAVVGGALGTASGTLTGTANMLQGR
ncbi:MAG TPA: hypothetical protein VKQ73_10335 [Stellaceae bacterium]|nr:hypothetical protein [Stellaceae bacterium]